jgi:serine/threonine protein phosphatase PrpC
LQANPGKKINLQFSLDIVLAMGRDKSFYEQGKAQGLQQFPVDYKLLKRLMGSSLGSEKADPALSIRRLDPGDTLIISSDGHTDLYEKADGETDYEALGNEFRGDSQVEDLNRARKAAKAKVSAAKDDDDIAIVTARAA